MTATETIFERIGGQAAVDQVVDKFYDKVLADPVVNGFFKNTDMAKQRRHQAAFIGFALGSGKNYTGKSMEKAHEGMNLQPVHFDAIVNHLATTLREFHVSQDDIDQIAEKLGTLKDSILYK